MINTSIEIYGEIVLKQSKEKWISLKSKYLQDQLSFKNISNLTKKAIKGKHDTKCLTKEQIRGHKRYWKEFIHCLNSVIVVKILLYQ